MPIHDWSRVTDGTFHSFHLLWMVEINNALNRGILPTGYYAMPEKSIAGVEPDILTFREMPTPISSNHPSGNGSTSVVPGGVMIADSPPQVDHIATWERSATAQTSRQIAIRDANGDRLIAVIEIVSPGNKSSQSAIRSFIRKVADFIDQGVHVLILDLFPPGPRDPNGIHPLITAEIGGPAFQLGSNVLLTFVSYLAIQQVSAYLRTASVGENVPEMPLFLTPERYVSIPLAPLYDAAFQNLPQRWRDIIAPPAI